MKRTFKKIQTKFLEAGLYFMAIFSMGAGKVFAQTQGEDLQTGVDKVTPDTYSTDLTGIIETIARTLIILVGLVSVIMLIIGGFRYVVSAGDSDAVSGAKNTILYAIIGLVVAFLSFAAVNFVIEQLTT